MPLLYLAVMSRTECQNCHRPSVVCYCDLLPELRNQWPVRILQESGESRHPLNTAGIAALSLGDCQLYTVEAGSADFQDPVDWQREAPALIYPGEQAEPVEALAEAPQRPLVFVDANWRKSRRLLHEMPWLSALPRFAIHDAPPSRYRIRSSRVADALSTLEAIVHTLELVEKVPGRYAPMLDVMDWMVDQQIRYMGKEVYQRNYRQ